MGADISIKIRLIDEKNQQKSEVEVSERDNEFHQYLFKSEEYKSLWMNQIDEATMEGELLEAQQTLETLNRVSIQAYTEFKNRINEASYQKYLISDGLEFFESLGKIMGIIKTAIELNYKIQFIGEIY